MKYTFLLFLIIALIMFACNDSPQTNGAAGRKDGYSQRPQTKEDSLFADISNAHDSAMSIMMRKLRGSKTKTQHFLDSMNSIQNAKPDTVWRRQLIDVQKELNAAELSMNNWMEAFVPDSAENNKEVRIKYLESERDKVLRMEILLSTAVKHADSVLKR